MQQTFRAVGKNIYGSTAGRVQTCTPGVSREPATYLRRVRRSSHAKSDADGPDELVVSLSNLEATSDTSVSSARQHRS